MKNWKVKVILAGQVALVHRDANTIEVDSQGGLGVWRIGVEPYGPRGDRSVLVAAYRPDAWLSAALEENL